jgi:hypothetical protein
MMVRTKKTFVRFLFYFRFSGGEWPGRAPQYTIITIITIIPGVFVDVGRILTLVTDPKRTAW